MTSLPPLYDYIDPEALDTPLDHADADPGREMSVDFRDGGRPVTVSGSGTLNIDEHVYGTDGKA